MPETPTSAIAPRTTNVIAGLVFAAFGVFLLIASQEFEDSGRSTPMFIGAGIVLLAAILVVSDFLKPAAADHGAADGGSQKRRLIFVVLMAAWVLLLPYLGFLVSGFIMFAIVAAAVPKHSRWTAKGLGLHAAAGVVTTAAFWVVLTQLLNVPLPEPTLFY